MPTGKTKIDQGMASRFGIVKSYLKLGQKEMAEVCDISQPMVSFIINGTREIPIHAIRNLFIKMNISPAFIIAGVGGIEYKVEKRTLVQDIRELRVEIEILKGYIEKQRQDIEILSKSNK